MQSTRIARGTAGVAGVALCLLACSAPSPSSTQAGALPSTGTTGRIVEPEGFASAFPRVWRLPRASSEIKHDARAPLRASPTSWTSVGPARGSRAVRAGTIPPPAIPFFSRGPAQLDSLLQTGASPALATIPGLDFDGVVPTSTPPDANGAVGATQFFEWVNLVFGVFDKTTGALEFGPADGSAFWTGFGGPCEFSDSGDVIAQYDKAAARWVAQRPVFGSAGGELCLAVSTTADALGSYNRYAFALPGNPDFPKLGVWSDGYYVSINTPDYSVCAVDRASMLVGAPATMQCFQIPGGLFNFLPADIDGLTPPPPGAPGVFLEPGHDNASLRLWQMHADFANPANATLTGPITLPVAPYNPACDTCPTVPQAGATALLDTVSGLHYRLAYRNFGSQDSMVVSQSVLAGSTVGMRWYEIRNPTTSPTVFQQGTFAPDASFRWMGSIAMDHAGDMAMGYSVSSSTMNPSIAYTGRVPTDPLGTMEAENTILVGPGAYTTNRWGDYSSMSVDPVDDCTFWYTTEYVKVTGDGTNTRIASFKFPSCTSAADFAVSASPSAVTAAAGGQAIYTFRAAAAGTFSSAINLAVSGLPAGASFAFSPASIAGGSGSSTLTISTSASTPAGTYPLTIRGSSGSLTHTAVVDLTVGTPPPPACVTASGGAGWQNTPFGSQSGTFAAAFDATPLNAPITAFVGLSKGAQTAQSAFAALVRFNPSGNVDALNGTAFQAATTFPYAIGVTYHFRLVVNVAAHTYSIFVTAPEAPEQTLGVNFAFAPSQSAVASLDSWAAELDSGGGNLNACDFLASTGDFALSVTPGARTVPPGASGAWTLMTTAQSGFQGAVSFSVTGLPTGAVAAFNPPSVDGTGTSEMSVVTDPETPPGTYPLQIVASDGVNAHAVGVTLVVGPLPDGGTDAGTDASADAASRDAAGDAAGLTGCASGSTLIAETGCASFGSFGTTGAVCVKVKVNTVNGWEASSVQGRTATVQGATTEGPITPSNGSIPNQPGLSAGSDGFVYFNFTAGSFPYSSMACW